MLIEQRGEGNIGVVFIEERESRKVGENRAHGSGRRKYVCRLSGVFAATGVPRWTRRRKKRGATAWEEFQKTSDRRKERREVLCSPTRKTAKNIRELGGL